MLWFKILTGVTWLTLIISLCYATLLELFNLNNEHVSNFKKINKDRDTDESQESYLWLYLELVIRITECVKTWDEIVNFVFNC